MNRFLQSHLETPVKVVQHFANLENRFRYPVSVSSHEPFDRNTVLLRYEFEISPREALTEKAFFTVVRNCEDYIAFRIGADRPLRAKRIPKAWRARRPGR